MKGMFNGPFKRHALSVYPSCSCIPKICKSRSLGTAPDQSKYLHEESALPSYTVPLDKDVLLDFAGTTVSESSSTHPGH